MKPALPFVLLALSAPLAHPQGVLVSVTGDSAGDNLGESVAFAGDVDGDGFADVAAGAALDDPNGTSSGSVRVVSGKDGSLLLVVTGDSAGDGLGTAVAGIGDVNQDGRADLVAGAPFDDDGDLDAGTVRVVSGADGATLFLFVGDAMDDFLGGAVAGAGDVDLDGFPDVVAGARTADANGANSGRVRVWSGQHGTVLHDFVGDGAGDTFGAAVGGGGDVNGDGFADVVGGAPLDDDTGSAAGTVRVCSGLDGTVLQGVAGDGAGDWLGHAVALAGDLDGDGFADVLAGAPFDDDGGAEAGSVRAWSGQTGAVLFTAHGAAAGDQLGWSVARAGDVDQDGLGDVVAGAHNDDVGGVDTGSARVLAGPTGGLLFLLRGDGSADRFGRGVAGGGDANQDGHADFIVGAYRDDDNGLDSGTATVFGGTSCGGTAVPYGSGCAGAGGFVPSLAVTGCLAQGGVGAVQVADGPGGGMAMIFFGSTQAAVAMDGGCFALVFPVAFGTPFVLSGGGPGAGTATLSFEVPFPAPDVVARMQVYVADPGVPHGFCNSNAVTVAVHR